MAGNIKKLAFRTRRRKMDKAVGLWIDHKNAYIVSVAKGELTLKHIRSRLGRKHKSTGGKHQSLPYSMERGSGMKKVEHRRENLKHQYYVRVIGEIEDANSIYVFGPSEAKKELGHLINENKSLSEKLVKVEASDALTERQILAKVRDFYRTRPTG